jgi:hypothetical protein
MGGSARLDQQKPAVRDINLDVRPAGHHQIVLISGALLPEAVNIVLGAALRNRNDYSYGFSGCGTARISLTLTSGISTVASGLGSAR